MSNLDGQSLERLMTMTQLQIAIPTRPAIRQVNARPGFRHSIYMRRLTLKLLLVFVLLSGATIAVENIPADSEGALDLWPQSVDAQLSRAFDFLEGKNDILYEPHRGSKWLLNMATLRLRACRVQCMPMAMESRRMALKPRNGSAQLPTRVTH